MRGGFRAWAGRVPWLVAILAVLVAMPPPAIHTTSSIAASALPVHPTIYIQGDANFTKNYTRSGVTPGGAGTPSNPYVIERWDINASSVVGIYIRNTTASFVIRDVRVHDGRYEGIYLQAVSNARVERAVSETNMVGLQIERSNTVVVNASTFRSNQASGIVVLNSQAVRIQGNVATGGNNGAIAMKDSADVTISGNQVWSAKYGIWLYGVYRATVSSNDAQWNFVGISLQGMDGSVTNNTLAHNSNTGLEASTTGFVNLTWNNVSTNGIYGIYLYHWTGLLHHNHFGLYQRSWDADDHNWDGGYPTGGNWWADYRGLDRCSGPAQDICPKQDGFGDTPMLVGGGSRDRYPRLFPDKPPTARFTMTTVPPMVYEPVTFNASTSTDPDGRVVDFTWDFGDGTKGSGAIVRHAFVSPGGYHVTLDIMDNGSGIDRAAQDLSVQPLDFVPYSGGGFRIPVPKDWTLGENVAVANRTVALQVLGPVRSSVSTSILLSTERDPAVREDADYLDAAMDTVVRGLSQGGVAAVRTQEPLHRTIAGHASVTFVVQYGTTSLFQKVVLVVSQAHERSWTFTLTSSRDFYETSNAILERMLSGFEITLAPVPVVYPLSEGQVLLAYAFGPALIAFLVTAVLVGRANRRKRLPTTRSSPRRSAPPPSRRRVPPSAPTRAIRASAPVRRPVRFCPRCGTPATKGSVCLKCGALMRS
jgi:parallel beta-helix repeat protein